MSALVQRLVVTLGVDLTRTRHVDHRIFSPTCRRSSRRCSRLPTKRFFSDRSQDEEYDWRLHEKMRGEMSRDRFATEAKHMQYVAAIVPYDEPYVLLQ